MIRALVLMCVVSSPLFAAVQGWKADPKLQAELEAKKTKWLYREEGVPAYTLADPLVAADGARVETREQREAKRRPETLELFRTWVYGRSPAAPAGVTFDVVETDAKAMDGKATLKRVKITSRDAAGKSFAFEAAVLTPSRYPAARQLALQCGIDLEG